MPLSPDQMMDSIIRNLPAKTGRALEEWIEIVRTQGPEKHKARVDWLKQTHGLGHVTAEIIVWEAEKPADYVPPTDQELLDAQYVGEKAALRPLYDRLAQAAQALGKDVELSPRQTYVSLIRGKQFGVVQASTKSRVDLGLRLPGVESTDRLREAGSFGSGSVTHRVALTSPEDVDDEVMGWLRAAYEVRG